VPIDLDDIDALRELDASGALAETDRYADQFREGRALVEGLQVSAGEAPANVMILGTGGGSAAAAKLLIAVVTRRSPIPILLNQSYEIPAHVGPDTFVIAVSHSGTTEEIVSAYEQALAKGCNSIALTSGGPLKELAEANAAPVIAVPGGKMPRIVLGYLLMPLLGVLERLGLVVTDADEIEDLLDVLTEGPPRLGAEIPLDSNPAKQLAMRLRDRTPVIYGLNPLTNAAGDRWKRQFGENSKVMAFTNAFPDAHHDEAVGWDQEHDVLERFFFVILSDDRADPRLLRRVSASRAVITERGGAVDVVEATGRGTLGRLFSLVQYGDYVTLYLALARGLDPTPVAVIDHFKSVLAKA
jgi:glucose/mannose-6-phosphate isomerase